jgi:uncharacterized protein (TIGR00299 family) protein
MKICYLDCFSGIAGDMLLGALIDAGLDVEVLRSELSTLNLEGVELHAEKAKRGGLAGTNVSVKVAHDHHHRSLSTIEKIIDESELAEGVKSTARKIFRRLGEVEALAHDVPIEKVHFHEVGALDAIVDIVGAAIGFEALGIERIVCSPINLGSGTVEAAHGVMPVPAPATARLVEGVPTYSDGPAVELTTPTGAAIAVTLAESFGPLPAMRIEASGYGAGDRDFKGRANLLRVLIGETVDVPEATEIRVIEANIDDMSPELAGYVRERLLEAGALDVTLTPVFMKKDRPGFTLTVLAAPADRVRLGDLIFAESTTIGIREYSAQRRVLERRVEHVTTAYGTVRMKVAASNGATRNFAPEYEDCRRIAREKDIPFKEVWQAANFEYLKRDGG